MSNHRRMGNEALTTLKTLVNRRTLLRGSAAGAAGLGLAALGGRSDVDRVQAAQDAVCGGEEITITYGFWDPRSCPAVEAADRGLQGAAPQHHHRAAGGAVGRLLDQAADRGRRRGRDLRCLLAERRQLAGLRRAGRHSCRSSRSSTTAASMPTPTRNRCGASTPSRERSTASRATSTRSPSSTTRISSTRPGWNIPTGDWTWDDLRAAAEALTVKDGDTTTQWGFASTLERATELRQPDQAERRRHPQRREDRGPARRAGGVRGTAICRRFHRRRARRHRSPCSRQTIRTKRSSRPA